MDALAPELIDLVIDHLHNDVHALRACSLVCKAWTRSAHYHLFNRLRPLFLNEHNWAKRQRLLQSGSIVPLIRDIWLSGNLSVANVQFWNTRPFSTLTAQFQSLETLRLHDIPWYQISPRARSSLLAPFSSVHVTKLHLGGISDIFVSYVVGAFPSLVHLIGDISIPRTAGLKQISFKFRHRIPATLRDVRLSNHTISTSESRVHAVLESFLLCDSLPAIRNVGFRQISLIDIRSINSFIAGLGPALQTFVCDTVFDRIACPAIDFSSNTSLGAVQFRVLQFYIQQTRWITQSLSTICSPAISSVTLVFYPSVPLSDITADNWAGVGSIDEVLSRPIFSALTTVEISAPHSGDEVLSYFAPHLPLCHARGILRFIDHDEARFDFPW